MQEFRQAWCIGAEAFRRECLERMEGKVGENHPGQTRLETAQAKAERIVAEELARLKWTGPTRYLMPNDEDRGIFLRSDPAHAWYSRQTPYFQAVGDPFVTK